MNGELKNRLQKLAAVPSNLAFMPTGRHLSEDRATSKSIGTFYVLAGKLNDGFVLIDKALEINPHAHFDRERLRGNIIKRSTSIIRA